MWKTERKQQGHIARSPRIVRWSLDVSLLYRKRKLPVLYRAFRILNDPTMLKYEKQLQQNIPEIWKLSI